MVSSAPQAGHFVRRPACSSLAWSILPQLQENVIAMSEFPR
jgi:hypothetical protein